VPHDPDPRSSRIDPVNRVDTDAAACGVSGMHLRYLDGQPTPDTWHTRVLREVAVISHCCEVHGIES